MTKFHYISAPAGAGKTYQLSQWAIKQAAKGEKILIAQPTLILMRETQKAIRKMDSTTKVTMFQSNRSLDSVASRIQNYVAETNPLLGEIAIITHEALSRFTESHSKFWNLFVDEAPSVFKEQQVMVPETRHLITTSTKKGGELINGAFELVEGSPLLKKIATVKDDGYAPFADLAGAILDPTVRVFVDGSKYDDLVSNQKNNGEFCAYSIKQSGCFSHFKTTTLMSANFEDTELYGFWETFENITWVKHDIQKIIENGTRFAGGIHNNGNRLTIRYFFDIDSSGEHLKRSDPVSGESNFDKICDKVDQLVNDADLLWHVNKNNQSKTPFNQAGMLPMVCHGLNQPGFVATHNVAMLSSFNYSSKAYSFFKMIGFDSNRVRIMLDYQKDYQSIMRCSLRDPDATAPVTVYVMGKAAAEYIQSKFPGSEIEKIDHVIDEPTPAGRPTIGNAKMTNAEKQKAFRARQKAKK